jgi:hypothetical protein
MVRVGGTIAEAPRVWGMHCVPQTGLKWILCLENLIKVFRVRKGSLLGVEKIIPMLKSSLSPLTEA